MKHLIFLILIFSLTSCFREYPCMDKEGKFVVWRINSSKAGQFLIPEKVEKICNLLRVE